jgi:hypothetical protein
MAGTSRLIEIPVRDENGDLIDLSGGRAVFWVGKAPTSTGSDVLIQKNGVVAEDPDTPGLWVVSVTLGPSDTENMPPRCSYYFECRVWDSSNNEYVAVSGQFDLDPSMTLPAA